MNFLEATCALFLTLGMLLRETEQGPYERKLLNHLLSDYNVLERPVENESDAVEVKFGVTLQQIIDVDEKNQIFKANIWTKMDEKNQLLLTNLWLKMVWVDSNLKWNESEYNNIQDLRIPPNKIWKPDVLLYNSADERFDVTYPSNIVVMSNGSCLFMPPGIFKSTCKIDITFFPFDDQKCVLKFGSWSYSGQKLDLVLFDDEGGDTSTYITNGEWELIGMPAIRNVESYLCCPEIYVDIKFTVHIRRRTLYYLTNLIIPCLLISSMTLLSFLLPPDSGEKLTLGVTILLSLTVFLNMVAEKMPATSEAVPIIGVTILLSLTVFHNLVAEKLPQVSDALPILGTYFNCIMFMVASSVVLTVVILNYHHRKAETHEMPMWIRTLFLEWLPWILRMSRPGRKLTRKLIIQSNKVRQFEKKEKSSRSLLANVLDMEDDYRSSIIASVPGLPIEPAPSKTFLHFPDRDSSRCYNFSSAAMNDQSTVAFSGCSREIQLILKELRIITDQIRREEEEKDISSDWKFAAMVVDRICLMIFTLFTILATVVIFLMAPHFVV